MMNMPVQQALDGMALDDVQKITQSVYRALTIPRATNADGEPIPNSSIMDLLFDMLDAAYPLKWRGAYPTVEDRDMWLGVWAERFANERIDQARIKLAMSQIGMVQTGFVPTLEEFVKASRPVIDYEKSYAFCLFQWRKRYVLKTRDNWASHNIANVKDRQLFAAACEMQASMDAATEYRTVKQQWMLVLDEMVARDDLPPVPPVEIPAPKLTISPEAKAEAEKPIIGAREANIPFADQGQLALMLNSTRELYKALRRSYVDIAHDDPLLEQWVASRMAERVLRQAQSAATCPNSRLMRYMWYTPQQMRLHGANGGAV